MKLTRSTEYALLAVGYIARHSPTGAVVAQRIAEENHIPRGYLLKILQQLVRGNILDSVRGPQGGFILARPAEDISLLEVIEAIEGPLTTSWSPATDTSGHFHRTLQDTCRRATEQATRILAGTSLAWLLGDTDTPPSTRPERKTPPAMRRTVKRSS